MTFELTPEGLDTQTQAEIVEELSAQLRSTFGNNLNTSVSSIMGQIVNIIAEFRALDQQVALAIYRSFDPNSALGTALDRLAALTGSLREGETFSVVDGILTFSGAGTVANGDLIQNDDNSTQWKAINGPYIAVGPEDIAATFQAVVAGPTLANANTNWSLVSPIPGLTGFTNPADDADLGSLQQDDPDFRVDRQVELYSQNIGGLLAIRGVVSKVNGVTSVRVYHNPKTQPVDSDGIPFKAFNVVVETAPSPPGATLQQTIADAIFSVTGAGGEAFGTDFPNTVTDVEGGIHSVSFDLVDEVDVFVKIDVSFDDTEQAISENIASVIQAAVLEHAQANFSGLGQNQIAFEYVGIVSALQETGEISGLTSVVVNLSRTSLIGPYADPLQIEIRERPSFESVNIQVAIPL